MAWTTLAEEETRLDELALSARVAVDEIGMSAGGLPLRLVRIGDPGPPEVTDRAALLVVGAQHGNEPAGREAALDLVYHLATVQVTSRSMLSPGGSGNYASTPDTGVLDITGDIDLRADVTPVSWTPSVFAYFLSKYTTTGNQRGVALRIDSTGQLQLAWSSDGTAVLSATATELPVPNPFTGRLATRATLDVDDGAGNRVVTFYTAPSGVDGPWTQLGDTVVQAGTTSIFPNTAPLVCNGINAGTNTVTAGTWHAAQLRNGIAGTVVANPDFSVPAAGAPSFADSAGRTWTINGTAAIVDTGDPALVDFLGDHGVLIIPTANPDGVLADNRDNADDIDINRDHIALETTEVQAIATVLGQSRPLVLLDLHEGEASLVEQLTFAPPSNPQTHPNIVAHANGIITAMKARATTEAWTNGDYPSITGRENRLVSCSGLRHTAAVLVETLFGDDTESGQALRLQQHTAMVDETLEYVITNVATILADADAAAVDVAAEGAAGVEPFDLRTVTLDPPPLAYRIVGTAPLFHFQVFNITLSAGAVVSMAQAAQPIIPFLLDAAAEFVVQPSTRLFVLPSPDAPTGTVQEFARVVSGSHRVLFEARVLSTFEFGNDPTGDDLPIIGGDVQFDSTADVRATLEIETIGISQSDAKSLFPRRAGDLLAPYGTEVFVRRGVDLGDTTIWSPLGYFRINSVEQAGGAFDSIRLSCQDRMAGIVDARIVRPYFFRSSRTIQHIVDLLVTEVYPDAVVLFDDDSGQQAIGRQLVVDESRYAALREIAQSLGKIMYWDGDGFLRIEDPPDSEDIKWDIKAGSNGVLVDASRQVSREGMYNAVRATGEGVTSNPVQAIVVDRGPNSPTRWAGRFGRVPRFYSSPLLRTTLQARTAATALLRRSIGMPYAVNFGAVPNPALRPYDSVRITHQDGNRDRHLVEACTIPLTTDAHMTGRTRDQTRVDIGNLSIGEL